MKYVKVETINGGNYLDPDAYLGLLPALVDALPPNARAFATDPDHYDFFSRRCVKDLTPDSLLSGTIAGENWLQLGFRHNCWKHEEDLSIHYLGVTDLSIDKINQSAWTNAGTITLDEILPHDHGCSHEIDFLNGSLTIISHDLTATWTKSNCPDKTTNT